MLSSQSSLKQSRLTRIASSAAVVLMIRLLSAAGLPAQFSLGCLCQLHLKLLQTRVLCTTCDLASADRGFPSGVSKTHWLWTYEEQWVDSFLLVELSPV